MSGPTVILGVTLGVVFVGFLIGTRSHRPQGPGPEPVTAPGPYVWLACHGLACGHMSTRHLPTGDGKAICRECGTIRTDRP